MSGQGSGAFVPGQCAAPSGNAGGSCRSRTSGSGCSWWPGSWSPATAASPWRSPGRREGHESALRSAQWGPAWHARTRRAVRGAGLDPHPAFATAALSPRTTTLPSVQQTRQRGMGALSVGVAYRTLGRICMETSADRTTESTRSVAGGTKAATAARQSDRMKSRAIFEKLTGRRLAHPTVLICIPGGGQARRVWRVCASAAAARRGFVFAPSGW